MSTHGPSIPLFHNSFIYSIIIIVKHLNTLINVVFFFVFSETNEKLCLPRVLTFCVYILKSMDLFIFE